MKVVGAGFGDDIDLAAAELAVLGVEVIREDAELGDGIEIGNDCRAHVDVFFDVASIHDETVGEFPLAVDRDGAGIQIAGGREHGRAHVLHGVGGNRSDRSDSGLESQQIRVASAIERHSRHLRAGDNFAHLGIRCLGVDGAFVDGYRFRFFADFQGGVHDQGAIRVDDDAAATIGLESGLLDEDLVASYGEVEKRVEASRIRRHLSLNPGLEVCGLGDSPRDDGAARIIHRAGNTPANAGPGISRKGQQEKR